MTPQSSNTIRPAPTPRTDSHAQQARPQAPTDIHLPTNDAPHKPGCPCCAKVLSADAQGHLHTIEHHDGSVCPVLEVSDLSFSIQGRALLNEICLNLCAGELLIILGCNGAGKTTLLKHVTGDLASRKNITLFGQSLDEHHPKALARRRGVLAQNTSLSFNYEVEEVVMLGRIPHQRWRSDASEDQRIVAECLDRVGMTGYEHRNYLTLSGGEQQRVQLARVLAQLYDDTFSLKSPSLKPDTHKQPSLAPQAIERLLLLDEPTNSLDIAYQHQVLKIARELCAQQVGVLAILHDLNLASQYADKILVLCHGRVLAYGTPFDVMTSEVLATAFGHELLVVPHPCLNCPLVVSAK